jgi:hypothetical protein
MRRFLPIQTNKIMRALTNYLLGKDIDCLNTRSKKLNDNNPENQA